MRIGSPCNPYNVFQGVFAPYWILEREGIGSGAKLCYIRLLGFAGKDARCYPSLETLGRSLGVSDLASKSGQGRSEWFAAVNVAPRLEGLHADPRFSAVLRSVGLQK